MREPPFTIGIEEEYLLVDRETRDTAQEPPEEMMASCAARCDDQVTPEFLRAQIEIGTRVCKNVAEAREELKHLRGTIVEVAGEYGLAPIAASSHPFANWHQQKRTSKDRYAALETAMQASARRLLICGMHVHVGIDDDELRIDLMNQFTYFLPHLLALSCSSPFWEGSDTGLQSYRLTVFDGLPRTRLPESFSSFAEFERHVAVLVKSGVLEDSSKIWWDIRPSSRYQTLETRVMDVCTRLEDSLTLAALTQCLMRFLFRLRRGNQRWRNFANMLIQENRWRAMRYGCDGGLIDFGISQVVPYQSLLDEMLDLIAEDAEFFGCTSEVERARDIVTRGNSARRQVAAHAEAIASGASKEQALRAVVDMLIEETAMDL
ncbi:MAG: carboxylate-amine ligase [Pseudomonadota bacterium]